MAEKPDEIEIELDIPAQDDKKDAEIAIPGETKAIVTPEEGIKELQAQLAAERSEKEQLRTRAVQAENVASAAKSETDDTNLKLVTNAIATIKNNQAILKREYAAASAAGEHDKLAEINLQMSATVLDLKQLEAGEKAYKERAKQPPKQQPVATSSIDPESYAASLQKDFPRSAEWIRAHPQFARDEKLRRKMFRAHDDAMDEGIPADTDEYFRHVEAKLGLSEAPKQEIIVPDDPMKEAAQVTQRRSSPPAAPVSRATLNGSRPNTVRLSAQEREMAQMMGMTDQEYAKNKLALINEKKMSS